MKKQVQKIKENKGFSMIELIIIVAIMAILVGIIGAALIPYMEKSRAGKDKSALDSLYTAYASAIAESEEITGGKDPLLNGTSLTASGQKKVESLLDGGSISTLLGKLKSKQFKGITISDIEFNYKEDASKGAVYGIKVKSKGDKYQEIVIDNQGTESPIGVKKDAAPGNQNP